MLKNNFFFKNKNLIKELKLLNFIKKYKICHLGFKPTSIILKSKIQIFKDFDINMIKEIFIKLD